MNSVREENLKRNAAFMNQLGFSEKRCERDTTLSHEQDVSNRKRKTSRTTVGIESSSSKSQRKSIRIQSNEEKIAIEYKCDKCFNRKIYDSLKGLRIHQSRDCIALDNYKPSSYCILSGEEMKTMFNLNQKFQEIRPKDSSALSATHSQVSFLQQTIFQDNDHVTLQNDQNIELSDEQNNENICTEENPIADDPITSFAEEQEKICSFIFGIEYIHSLTFESMVQAVQMHYEKTETKKSFTKSMSQNSLYQFSIESGLSRNECVKLLSVIKSFDPRIPVPKTFHGVENRMRKSLDQHNDCVQIIVPWIESWRMNELRGFQPVTIYVRNIFEIIAHMLIDPEIMFIWRKHIHFSYYRATDRNNNQVYSDLMSSNWAHETEKMIKSRNQQGNLMPLIMYTDGVQVGNSVHNKITPVILSLGIFSDTLLQKDISKRVIAYLPNFRCYSKDIIISHLVSKLSVSKSKVRC